MLSDPSESPSSVRAGADRCRLTFALAAVVAARCSGGLRMPSSKLWSPIRARVARLTDQRHIRYRLVSVAGLVARPVRLEDGRVAGMVAWLVGVLALTVWWLTVGLRSQH